MTAVGEASHRIPFVFPCHPRTRKALDAFGLSGVLREAAIEILEPQGYGAMLALLRSARCVLTDSGGLQEETTALGIPCLTLRDNTERPITIEIGSNALVGTDPARISAGLDDILAGRWKSGRVPDNWDGHASERISAVLARTF
jgi:UDP-N-acetylglucosamine 2-epimerase (non-hydrolysing)